MTASGSALPRGTTGRADLLRLLAVAPRDRVVIDADASGWSGYERRPKPAFQPTALDIPAITTVAPAPASSARLGPFKIPFLHAIVRRTARSWRPGETPSGPPAEDLGPLSDADVQAPERGRQIEYEDLIPPARLMPMLRRQLGTRRAGPLDLDQLIRTLATRRLLRHLPRLRLQRWRPDLVVVFDFCSRLWPYREDMHRLAERLLRYVGRSGVSLRIMSYGPLGPWTDWLAHQDLRSVLPPKPSPWKMPPAGSQVLIVSDFGLLLGPDSATAQAWQQFIADSAAPKSAPWHLLRSVRNSSTSRSVCRSCAGALMLGRGRSERAAQASRSRMASMTFSQWRRLSGELIRHSCARCASLCRRRRSTPVWKGRSGATTTSMRLPLPAFGRRRANGTSPGSPSDCLPFMRAIDRLRVKHHAHLRAALNHEETLLWDGYADEEARGDAEVRRRVASAREFFGKLAKTVGVAGYAASAWRNVAESMLHRGDAAMCRRHGDVMYELLAATLRARVTRWLPSRPGPIRLASRRCSAAIIRRRRAGWCRMRRAPRSFYKPSRPLRARSQWASRSRFAVVQACKSRECKSLDGFHKATCLYASRR